MVRMRWTVLAAILAMPLAAMAAVQDMGALVEAALDQQIRTRIEISERPIRDALRDLESFTGLRFAVGPQAIDWMPYGEQTRIGIVLEGVSVRTGLGRIFDGLGLAMHVEADRVVVEPAPVLWRLGRRLTLDEVGLLRTLASGPWTDALTGTVAVQYQVESEGDPQVLLTKALRATPAENAARQLELATASLGWLWVPEGKSVVVFSRSADIQQRLDVLMDFQYRQVPLEKLLMDLGRRIDVNIRFEPGALARVAASERFVDFVQRQTSVRQVLELLAGRTGLWYEVVEDGLLIGAVPPEQPAAASTRPPIVAILRVPVGTDGTTIDFLIRADELPEEFAALKDRKLPEVIEEVRRRLEE